MADTTFTAGTVIASPWLNDVNDYVYAQNISILDTQTGVDPTGVAECSTAVQAAIDAAEAANKKLVSTGGTFLLSSKVVLKGDCDLSLALFNIDGAPTIGVEISTGDAANPTTYLSNKTMFLPTIYNLDKPATGWVGQGIGLRVVNAQTCEIHLGKIYGFAVGAQFTAYSQGCVYNSFFLKQMYNNLVQIQLAPGNASGWVNENTFYNGSLLYISGEGTNISGARQVLLTHFASGNIINNNRFFGVAFEGDGPEYVVEDQGSQNHYIYCRWEATTNKVYLNGTPTSPSTMEGHTFFGGYAPNGITTTFAGTVYNTKVDVGRKIGRTFLDMGDQVSVSNGDATPAYTVYPSTVVEPWEKTSASTDWLVQLTGRTLVGKRTDDAAASFRAGLDFDNGRVYVNTGVFWRSGSGSPESVVTAPVGSIYSRIDGGASTSFYVKESGAGNTGWVAK